MNSIDLWLPEEVVWVDHADEPNEVSTQDSSSHKLPRGETKQSAL